VKSERPTSQFHIQSVQHSLVIRRVNSNAGGSHLFCFMLRARISRTITGVLLVSCISLADPLLAVRRKTSAVEWSTRQHTPELLSLLPWPIVKAPKIKGHEVGLATAYLKLSTMVMEPLG
jgi:hypothetical protein